MEKKTETTIMGYTGIIGYISTPPAITFLVTTSEDILRPALAPLSADVLEGAMGPWGTRTHGKVK